jgi:hypothetical protein
MKHQKKSTYGQGGEGVFFLQQGGEDRPYVKKTINAFFFYFHREKYFFSEDQNSGGAMDCLAACRVVLRLRCCFASRLCFLFV